MTQSTPELLPTQADRDMAADLMAFVGHSPVDSVREGRMDDIDYVQWFARHRIEQSTPDRNAVLSVLETARDYFSDAANGTLTYEGSGDGFKAMAKEDLARLEAALTTTPEPTVEREVCLRERYMEDSYVCGCSKCCPPEPTDPAGVSELERILTATVEWRCDGPYDGTEICLLDLLTNNGGMTTEELVDAARQALTAALRTPSPVLEVVKEALEKALPRMAHKASCHKTRPAHEWAKLGSASFEDCGCEIKTVRAALQTIKEGSNHEG